VKPAPNGRVGDVLLALMLISVGACSTAPTAIGSRNVITQEALEQSGLQESSIWDAVERLRPNWLRSRTSTIGFDRVYPVVFVDGSRFGGVDVLRSLRVQNVDEIRYLSPQDATTRYGTGYLGGVIAITHRR
jgi:hypothetical protein